MALNLDQALTALGGLVFAIGGVHTIVTRKVTFGDNGDESQLWLYGWRAVAVGIGLLAVAALCFAGAAGVIHMGEA